MKSIACIVGARPNFMKMAPILEAFREYDRLEPILIHTGQHYDKNLSDVFFDQLKMPRPDIHLNVGSGTQAYQTARILERMEDELLRGSPNDHLYAALLVVGDVTSTMASTLAAAKLQIPVAHVEAGLRSFDRSMPEEINRLVTDSLTRWHFVSEDNGVANLLKEGHSKDCIHLVGNVMIDTLYRFLPAARETNIHDQFQIEKKNYCLVTLHRPSNVDGREQLGKLVDTLISISESTKIVFPIHPRTEKKLIEFGLLDRIKQAKDIVIAPPLGYLEFLSLSSEAQFIITDSGGLQEESTALEIPCLTMRSNTERPITVDQGTSVLIGNDVEALLDHVRLIQNGNYKQGSCPELWDGNAAQRIAKILSQQI